MAVTRTTRTWDVARLVGLAALLLPAAGAAQRLQAEGLPRLPHQVRREVRRAQVTRTRRSRRRSARTATSGTAWCRSSCSRRPATPSATAATSGRRIGMDKPNVHAGAQERQVRQLPRRPRLQRPAHAQGRGRRGLLRLPRREAFQTKTVHARASPRTAAAPATWPTPRPRRTCSRPSRGQALCTSCHNSGDAGFKKAHGGYPAKACSACHDPHASDGKKLLKASVHDPVASAACADCHAAPPPPSPSRCSEAGAALCANCHEAGQARRRRRRWCTPRSGAASAWPATIPHASDGPKLAKAPGNALCLTLPPGPGPEVRRRRTRWWTSRRGCLGCHAPHARKQKKLLDRPTPSRCCAGCHAKTTGRGRARRWSTRPFEGGDCVACHDPHGSNVAGDDEGRRQDRVCYGCHADAEPRFIKTYTHRPVLDGQLQRLPRGPRLGATRSCSRRRAPSSARAATAPS